MQKVVCENIEFMINNYTTSTFWEIFDRETWDENKEIIPISQQPRIDSLIDGYEKGKCILPPTLVCEYDKCKIMDGQKRVGISWHLGRRQMAVEKVYEM